MIFYRILSILLLPFLAIYLFVRILKGKEGKKRIGERLAISNIAKPQGELIWIHAVSVGETNSALILVNELLKIFPQIKILFTTTTITSAAILASKNNDFQGRVIHQFLPFDSYFIVRKFLKKFQPKKIIFVESEIWPNFIDIASSFDIPVFIVNGRMSQKSFLWWQKAHKIGFNIFDKFKVILAQSLEDQARFAKLTKNKVEFLGNLKSQAITLNFDQRELLKLHNAIGERPFWLAASTHKNEEEIILAIHKNLKEKFPDLLTIIVPRHPNRSLEIQGLLSDYNFSLRSKNQAINSQIEIYLADSLGELGLFYSLADFAFIGGSLINVGGHNPFEAIKLNCAVISGEFVFNFKEIYQELLAKKSCIIIKSQKHLEQKIEFFLTNKNAVKEQINQASKVIAISKKMLEDVLNIINEN